MRSIDHPLQFDGGACEELSQGLNLASDDRERIKLSGQTIIGEKAGREIWVSGPGGYVVLKSIAFRLRGENKDAFDLYCFGRNYGTGVDDIASRFTAPAE